MEGHIIVQGRIHGTGTEAEGDRDQAEDPEAARQGKAKKGQGRHQDADGGDGSRPEPPGHPIGQEAGNDRAAGDDHGDDARIG